MATYRPPIEFANPAVYLQPDPYYPVSNLAQRLFAHYTARPRGINVFKLIDGTYTSTQPWPNDDSTVAFTYLGGHTYEVTQAEKNALKAAGFPTS